jgi:hypothetical protein
MGPCSGSQYCTSEGHVTSDITVRLRHGCQPEVSLLVEGFIADLNLYIYNIYI